MRLPINESVNFQLIYEYEWYDLTPKKQSNYKRKWVTAFCTYTDYSHGTVPILGHIRNESMRNHFGTGSTIQK